jgi:hypothetical protein
VSFVAALGLFVLANIFVYWHYGYTQREETNLGRRLNSIHLWDAANRDDKDLKILFLGNSTNLLNMSLEDLQPLLKKVTDRDIQLYNLALLGATVVDYQILLSQLEMDETTLVVLPFSGVGFTQHTALMSSDLDSLFSWPSVFMRLGSDFYRDKLTIAQVRRSALKTLFPLYRHRRLIKRDLRQRYLTDSANPLVWSIVDSITQGVASDVEPDLIHRRTEETVSHLAALNEQANRALSRLEEDEIPSLAYLTPYRESRLPAVWFDNAEERKMAHAGIKQILREHQIEFHDLQGVHEDAEFQDYVHANSDIQLWHLWGSLRTAAPLVVLRVTPSSLGLTHLSRELEFDRSEVVPDRGTWWRASLQPSPLHGSSSVEPLALSAIVNGKNAVYDRAHRLRGGQPPRGTRYWSDGTTLFVRDSRRESAKPEVHLEYVARSDQRAFADPIVESLVWSYRLKFQQPVAERHVKRVTVKGNLLSRLYGSLDPEHGVWMFDSDDFVVVVPAGTQLSTRDVEILYHDPDSDPTGPLANAIRKLDQNLTARRSADNRSQ